MEDLYKKVKKIDFEIKEAFISPLEINSNGDIYDYSKYHNYMAKNGKALNGAVYKVPSKSTTSNK